MHKLLLYAVLSAVIACCSFAAQATEALTLTFNRTGTSASSVSVNTSGISGVSASLLSTSHNFRSTTKSTVASIICPNVNGNTRPTITLQFSITGLSSDLDLSSLGLHIHALNGADEYQMSDDGVLRQYNVTANVNGATFGLLTNIDIAAGISTNGKPHKDWTLDGTSPVEATSPLNLTLTITAGTTNSGCFFGLSSITLNFADTAPNYALTVTANGCEYTLEGAEDLTAVPEGTEMTLSNIVAPEGFEVSAVNYNGAPLEAVDGVYTFTVVADAELEIVTEAVVKKYIIAIAEAVNGIIHVTANGEAVENGTAVDDGTQLVITATPEDGYELATLTVNGAAFENGSEYTVMNDTEIAATFTKVAAPVQTYTYRRIYTDDSSRYYNYLGYTVNGETKELYSVNDPRTESYYVAPLQNQWQTEGAYIDFKDKVIEVPADAENFTITMKSNGNVCSSKWSQNAVLIDWNKNGVYNEEGETNGVINISKKPNEAGGGLVITATGDNDVIALPEGLEPGQTYSLLIAMTEPKGLDGKGDLWGTQWEWTKEIFADDVCSLINGQAYELTVLITEPAAQTTTYTLTVNANGCEYTLEGAEDLTAVPEGTEMTLSNIVAPAGFVVSTVKYNGTTLAAVDGVYTFVVEGDSELVINTKVAYQVSVQQNEGGTIALYNGDTEVENGSFVADGTMLSVVATPDAGYELESIYYNDQPLDGDLIIVEEAFVVSALFVKTVGPEPADIDDSVLIPAGTSAKPYTFRFDDAPLGSHVNGSNTESTDLRSRNLTYAAWVNIKSLGTDQVVMGNIQKGFSQACGAFLVKLKNGKLALNGRDATDISNFKDMTGSATTDAGTSLNEWVFIAVVADQEAKTVTLYKNCQPISSYTTTYGVGLLTDEAVFFLADAGTSLAFSEVQLWTKALNAEELKAAYQGRFTEAPEGLVAYYRAGYMSPASTTYMRNLGTENSTVGQVITGDYRLVGGWNPQFSNQTAVDVELSGNARQNATVNVTIEQPKGEGNLIKVTGADGREITDKADLFEEITVDVELSDNSELFSLDVTDAAGNITNYEGAPVSFPVESDITISADIITYYAINYESNAGGVLNVTVDGIAYDSGTSVEDGTEVLIEATANEGYELTSLTVNGEEFESGNTYTINGADINVVATFSKVYVDIDDSVLIPAGTSAKPYTFRFDDAPLGSHVNGTITESTDLRSRNLTYAAWVNIKTLGTDQVVMGNIQKGFSQACGAFLVKLKNGKLALNGRDATDISNFKDMTGSATTDAGTSLNEWVFIAVVADQEAKTVTLYKNCQPISSYTTTYGVGLLPDESMFFLADAGTSLAFSEAQLWTKALNAEELKAAYQGRFAEIPEGLAAYYRAGYMVEGSTSDLQNLAAEAGTPVGQIITGNYQLIGGWNPQFSNQSAVDVELTGEARRNAMVNVTIEQPKGEGDEIKVTGADGREITDKAELFEGITIEVVYSAASDFNSIKVTDAAGNVSTLNDNPAKYEVSGDITISADLTTWYTVNYESTEGGNLSVLINGFEYDSGTEVQDGTAIFITAAPDAGYQLASLTVNGEDFESGTSYIIDGANINIKAVFEEAEVEKFTVKGTIEHGRLMIMSDDYEVYEEIPEDGIELDGGMKYFIIASPESSSYAMKSFLVNGEDKLADVANNMYAIQSLDSDIEVKVVFALPTFRISGEVENGDEGGYTFEIRDNSNKALELDENGGVEVAKGSSVYFVIKSPTNTDPSVQYSFTLTDNGTTIDPSRIYPFSNDKMYSMFSVSENHHLVIKQDKTVGVFGIADDADNALTLVDGKIVAASENASIEVYDVAGRVVARAQGGEVAIDALVKGVYIARATVNGKNYTLKFYKN